MFVVRCSALQCVAVCCRVLRRDDMHAWVMPHADDSLVAHGKKTLQHTATRVMSSMEHITRVAVRCSVLQCVAVCCSVTVSSRTVVCISMSHVEMCCSALQCVAVCCSVLQCDALWCNVTVSSRTVVCVCLPWKTWLVLQCVAVSFPLSLSRTGRPTQRIICVPLLINRFRKEFYLSFSTNIYNPVPRILFSKISAQDHDFITRHMWLLHFRQAEICLVEMICTSGVPVSKRHLGGASP